MKNRFKNVYLSWYLRSFFFKKPLQLSNFLFKKNKTALQVYVIFSHRNNKYFDFMYVVKYQIFIHDSP